VDFLILILIPAYMLLSNSFGVRLANKSLLAVLFALLLYPVNLRAQASPEALIKAGYITKFPLFIEWPQETWPSEEAPINFCVYGQTKITNHIRELAKYTLVKKHPILVSQVRLLKDVDNCHLFYIAKGHSNKLTEIIQSLSKKPILIIASDPGFAKRGVHINFYRTPKHLRFELNEKAASASGLAIDFRLKSIGKLVGPIN